LEYASEMHDMVKRDRNAPSIVIWSFCNEYECNQPNNLTGIAFRHAAKAMDPTRPVGANGNTYALDVQGFSHKDSQYFENFHKQNPDVPLVLSECCSCTSQRSDTERNLPTCIRQQNSPGLLSFMTGSLGVWTLVDYYGEGHAWPHRSCSYGQFDLAAFPKPHAYWYRTNWLALMGEDTPGRPPLDSLHVARILSLPMSGSATIHTVASTEHQELIVDGQSLGKQSVTAGHDTQWNVPSHGPQCHFPVDLSDVQCHGLKDISSAKDAKACEMSCCKDNNCRVWQYSKEKGCWTGTSAQNCVPEASWVGAGAQQGFQNATLHALDDKGHVVASHTFVGGTAVHGIQLIVDVPSPSTGTGSALVLDGSDVAMIRAQVVDKNGTVVHHVPTNITFEVVQGPGEVVGTGNGNPTNLQRAVDPTVVTSKGVARGFVQVTQDCMSEHRGTILEVDVEKTGRVKVGKCSLTPISVRARGGGFTSNTIQIKVSDDPDMNAYGIAKIDPHSNFTYLDSFDS